MDIISESIDTKQTPETETVVGCPDMHKDLTECRQI